jgi:hypothetical protein
MILFTHHNFNTQPVIEFENYDGKYFQLICRLHNKIGFGPFRCDIKTEIDDQRILIEILPETNPSDLLMGMFYKCSTLSYRCINQEDVLMECLGKIKLENEYQQRIGFYKEGSQIEAYYKKFNNLVSKYIWSLDNSMGWITTSPESNFRLRYT